jgi:uncharacterized membrane protein YdjX (TVP38/TMEM64 family)
VGRYLAVAIGIATAILLAFLVVDILGIQLLVDPSPWMSHADAVAAGIGVGLLVGDVLLPVPSSLVMIAHGALFGIVIGAALSFVGSFVGAIVGFAIGRRGETLIARFVAPDSRARADRILERWGPLAIVVTRPLPILAETTIILAGASRLGWPKATIAMVIGTLPIAILYAIIGAGAGNAAGIGN